MINDLVVMILLVLAGTLVMKDQSDKGNKHKRGYITYELAVSLFVIVIAVISIAALFMLEICFLQSYK